MREDDMIFVKRLDMLELQAEAQYWRAMFDCLNESEVLIESDARNVTIYD